MTQCKIDLTGNVARYVQCPDSHITIKVMNVQLHDNGYACGEIAVAFATSLIHGEDPTQLHYKELLKSLQELC